MKEYLNTKNLVLKLKEKGLTVADDTKVENALKNINYFILKGYFSLFIYKDKNNRTVFINGVELRHLLAFYTFDKNIKTLILRSILDVEQKIKSVICDVISSKFGIDDIRYLNRKNYDLTNPYLDVNLRKVRRQRDTNGIKHSAYLYYKNKHGHIPFWVLSKLITLGAVYGLYVVMKPNDKDHIASNLIPTYLGRKRVKRFENLFSLIVNTRNLCAHDDILYSMSIKGSNVVPESLVNGFDFSQYQGKKIGESDFFAVLISLKHFLEVPEYGNLIDSVNENINILIANVPFIRKDIVLKIMNLPINFIDLKK